MFVSNAGFINDYGPRNFLRVIGSVGNKFFFFFYTRPLSQPGFCILFLSPFFLVSLINYSFIYLLFFFSKDRRAFRILMIFNR